MVHGSEQKGVQAENVAGDHKGQNLPFAVGQEPVAECHPMREHESRTGPVTLDRDVGIRREAFFTGAQRIEHADHERVPSPCDVRDHAPLPQPA